MTIEALFIPFKGTGRRRPSPPALSRAGALAASLADSDGVTCSGFGIMETGGRDWCASAARMTSSRYGRRRRPPRSWSGSGRRGSGRGSRRPAASGRGRRRSPIPSCGAGRSASGCAMRALPWPRTSPARRVARGARAGAGVHAPGRKGQAASDPGVRLGPPGQRPPGPGHPGGGRGGVQEGPALLHRRRRAPAERARPRPDGGVAGPPAP